MKFHTPLLQAIVSTVRQIFSENKKADKAIQFTLKSNKKWGARDRAFIAENCYDLVRWWRLYHFINQTEINDSREFIIWRLLGIKLFLQYKEPLPPIDVFSKINFKLVLMKQQEAAIDRKISESIPDWLDEIGETQIGANWSNLIKSLNHQAPLSIRVNTLKSNFNELEQKLAMANVKLRMVKNKPEAAIIDERINVFSLPEFQNGWFEVQDIGSQEIATFLDVKPGMRVIDACAGAGGKTLQLATLMQNKGTIIALDVEAWKLEELKKRAKRNGIHNIDIRAIEGKTIKRLKESADALLLDVPCSGLGVLKRNPDAKWKLSPKFIEEIQIIQYNILSQYSSMVKPKGKMVYATCSILPQENELQVEKFLKENPHWKLINQKNTNPMEEECDGFYMAMLVRE